MGERAALDIPTMKSILGPLRELLLVARIRPVHLGLLIILGLLTAISEGLSITLIIPLIQSQTGTGSNEIASRLSDLFSIFPEDQRLFWISASLLACILLKNALSYAYNLFFQWTNGTIGHRLRSRILRQLLSVGQSYLDSHDSGALLNTLGGETWRVTAAFSIFASSIINVCMTVILTVILLVISWKLTLATGVFLIAISLLLRLLTRRVKALGERATAANATISQRMIETVNGLRVVRAFGREDYEQSRFDRASLSVRDAFFSVDRVSGLVRPLSEVLIAPILLGVLVVTMTYDPGDFAISLVFLLFLYRLQPRIKQLDSDRVNLLALAAPIDSVRTLIADDDKPFVRGGTRTLPRLDGSILLRDVSLNYASTPRPALDRVTLEIELGKTTAFVGPSGAGKSSLISLLCRFYDPTAGTILLNGHALAEHDLRWWRSQIALVSQDVHLFNTTIGENIAYGKADATRDEVREAARRAHALEFIDQLPQGMETSIGDHGVRLSGGQRQRLALARAFVRNPQILILDEATNSLDVLSEQLIQDALIEFQRDRTVLVIAHRMSTVEHADKVVVLENGRVLESGSVAELLASGGLFARFHALQLRR